MKRLVLGMLAHVDSGKTTLCEELLYSSGMIRRPGRVDHGDAFLDSDELEKKRGITIFSSQAKLRSGDFDITVLDTPGHTDFSAEMERTLSVLDLAVLIVAANDGIMAHTRTLWKLLKRNGVPVFIFVNKMDLAVKKKDEITADIKEKLSERAVPLSGDPDEKMLEEAALYDEKLTELLLSGSEREEAVDALSRAIYGREIFPVFFGSALKGEGVKELLEGIKALTPDIYQGLDSGEASGRVFKVLHEKGDRLSFVKLESGALHPKDTVKVFTSDKDFSEEKINEIRAYSGDRGERIEEARPGEVVAVTGLGSAGAGCSLGKFIEKPEEVLEPYMTYMAFPLNKEDEGRLRDAVEILSQEDPKLAVSSGPKQGAVSIRIMGGVQIEVLEEVLKERFGIVAKLSEAGIIYKETITGEVEGVGHFEPLRHYAEVHLILSPGERGSGITVKNSVATDDLDINWQNLILHHITEKEIRGVLTGSALTDVEIELVSGRASKKHTEGGDFREATWRAIRQGLMQARELGYVKVLEPWMTFEIKVDTSHIGRAMTDIKNMGGSLEGPLMEGELSVITGRAPAKDLMNYGEVLRGYARGEYSFSHAFDGYDLCSDEERVIEDASYIAERDTEYTADSVFCSKGSSDIVPWNEVYENMHLASVLEARKKGGSQAAQDTDSMLINQALEEKRKREYRDKLATDKELMAIFERTYGPVKKRERDHKPFEESKAVKASGVKHVSKDKGDAKEREKYLFIDGYNLIHAWPELKNLSETDFGAARDRLIDIICNYAAFMGIDATVVFDAYKVTEGAGARTRVHGVNVVYTVEHQTADAYIEKATHEIMKRGSGKGASKDIQVVSSDALVQQLAMGHGALRISSREFIEEIGRVENMIRDLNK